MNREEGIVDAETRGWHELGNSTELKSAELVAGMQAVTFPAPEWDYLSTATGRWFASFFFNMIKNTAMANATGTRNLCLTRLAEDVLAQGSTPGLIVEIGALFSPRGLKMAQQYPTTQVIEIGLPPIIEAKMERLSRYLGGPLPPNLKFIKADLRVQPLRAVLKQDAADLVIAEGFLPFCSPELIIQIGESVGGCLKPGGVFLADTVSSQGWKKVEGLNRMAALIFARQMGEFKGQVDDAASIQKLFEQAGYSAVEVYGQEALTAKYLPNSVTADVSFIVVGRKNRIS